jgi:hypothetical protein
MTKINLIINSPIQGGYCVCRNHALSQRHIPNQRAGVGLIGGKPAAARTHFGAEFGLRLLNGWHDG